MCALYNDCKHSLRAPWKLHYENIDQYTECLLLCVAYMWYLPTPPRVLIKG